MAVAAADLVAFRTELETRFDAMLAASGGASNPDADLEGKLRDLRVRELVDDSFWPGLLEAVPVLMAADDGEPSDGWPAAWIVANAPELLAHFDDVLAGLA